MKKPLKIFLIIFYVLTALVLFKLLFTYFYNERKIDKYNKGDYDSYFDLLTNFNFPEPYKVYYNNGNVYYKQGEYGKAADHYREALKKNPDHPDECSIRVNLALSLLYSLGDDYAIPENKEESLSVLKEARDILLEEECASDEKDGHSKEAQKLKEEIDDLIKELEEKNPPRDQNDDSQGGNNNQDNQNQNENNENNENEEQEKSLRDQLMEMQQYNYQERQKGLESDREMDDFSSFLDYFGGKIW